MLTENSLWLLVKKDIVRFPVFSDFIGSEE